MKILRTVLIFLGVMGLLTGCAAPEKPTHRADTLVVGTLSFDGKFSPFFYTNAYENDVISLVHLPLLGTDREGSVILNGIQGETRPYNGTDYTYTGIADCQVTENSDGSMEITFEFEEETSIFKNETVTFEQGEDYIKLGLTTYNKVKK